jgi:glycosyltransferase involved in cell wall biosynthesis
VYGDGALRPAMESFLGARRLAPRVRFMGFRRDWRGDAAECDVFVLPARFEGMSNTLLEAAAAGLPIVTTDIPENRFLLQPGEALFVAPDGVDDLAAAIRRVALEPGLAAGLSEAALSAPERFTAPAMVRAHEQVYAELARERSRCRAA